MNARKPTPQVRPYDLSASWVPSEAVLFSQPTTRKRSAASPEAAVLTDRWTPQVLWWFVHGLQGSVGRSVLVGTVSEVG